MWKFDQWEIGQTSTFKKKLKGKEGAGTTILIKKKEVEERNGEKQNPPPPGERGEMPQYEDTGNGLVVRKEKGKNMPRRRGKERSLEEVRSGVEVTGALWSQPQQKQKRGGKLSGRQGEKKKRGGGLLGQKSKELRSARRGNGGGDAKWKTNNTRGGSEERDPLGYVHRETTR